MNKFIAVILFFTFASFKLTAQKVSGTVTESGRAAEGATIALLKALDSTTVKFSIAGKDGAFQFDGIAAGSYRVKASAVGFSPFVSAPFEVTAGSDKQLAPIELVAASKSLSGITVTARRPFIEQRMDKMLVNVDAAVTNAGSTALDILEKSPGVTVDREGAISLKGKQGVLILIDGRPSYLTGADLTTYLRSLPSGALDQIEIMTNPPAKYDAAGNGGVINIKTKKNKIKGLNGNLSLNYGQGKYWKTANSVNLAYRNDKWNVFANANQSRWNGFERLDLHRTFKNKSNGAVNAIFQQSSFMPRTNDYYGLKLGADYSVNAQTTLGFVLSGFLNPETARSFNTSYLMNPQARIDSIVDAKSVVNKLWRNGSVNFNLRHKLDTTGREISADLDYVSYNSDADQRFVNSSFLPDRSPMAERIVTSTLPIVIDIYSAKVDYSHPVKGGWQLDAGAKTSYVSTQNGAFYYNWNGGSKATDNAKTNSFLYRENITALYGNVARQWGKWSVQTGLRFENTAYNGKQYGNALKKDSLFNRTYSSFFPTAFLTYKATDNHNFGLSVGRRIQRPDYEDLNPFLFFLDEYTYESGNPFIRPQFTNNIELSHTYKGILVTTLNYNRTTDHMMQTFNQEQNTATGNGYASVIRRGNIGEVTAGGVSVSAQLNPAKWWSANLYSNFNYSRFRGKLETEVLDIEAANLLFNVTQQFKLGKGWNAELSGFYRTKGIEGQIQIRPLGQLSSGISKSVLKEKGTLKLNVRDILYTNQAKGTVTFNTTHAEFHNWRESRVANLTFTYRFGKPMKNNSPKRSTGANDILNRVKAGGGN